MKQTKIELMKEALDEIKRTNNCSDEEALTFMFIMFQDRIPATALKQLKQTAIQVRARKEGK